MKIETENINESQNQQLNIVALSHNAISKVIKDLLDIPKHKVKYALRTGLLLGAFETLKRYRIELNEQTFSIFYDELNTKLSGNDDIEYEWSEEEYEAMMVIRQHCG